RAICADQSSFHRAARRPHGALDDIQVRWERLVLGNDYIAIGSQPDRGMDGLVEIDRRGVADEGLTRCCPNKRSDAIAKPDRHIEPSRAVPALDKVLAPFLFNRAIQNACRGAWHRAERISVEIDDAL